MKQYKIPVRHFYKVYCKNLAQKRATLLYAGQEADKTKYSTASHT